jgi:hypothetical protein
MKTHAPASQTMTALLAAALVVGVSLPAAAQETSATTPGGWSFALTPYIWFASLDGDVGVAPNLPTASVDADFDDIIENADFAFMLAAEARRGRFGVLTDINYLSLSDDGDTPGPLFGDAKVEVDTLFATIGGFYRAVAGERLSLDGVAGARIWYIDSEIDLSTGLLPGRDAGDDELWADPIIGLRWHTRLGRGFFIAGAADVGGFGVASDSTWELLGTLGYQFSDWFAARAGYRHLKVDYEDGGFVWDVELSGPIVGATFRF